MAHKKDNQLQYGLAVVVVLIGVLYVISMFIGKGSNATDDQKVQLTPVAENSAGVAAPENMYLGMKTWNWVKAKDAAGKVVTPTSDKPFTLSFDFQTGKFSVTTDCNPGNGFFAAQSGVIAFGKIESGGAQCDGSLESAFNGFLSNSNRFFFTSAGEMVLTTKDGSSVVFK